MCYTNECNANHISRKLYNIELPKEHKKILERIEFELIKFNNMYGPIQDNSLYFFVVDLCWKRKNAELNNY